MSSPRMTITFGLRTSAAAAARGDDAPKPELKRRPTERGLSSVLLESERRPIMQNYFGLPLDAVQRKTRQGQDRLPAGKPRRRPIIIAPRQKQARPPARSQGVCFHAVHNPIVFPRYRSRLGIDRAGRRTPTRRGCWQRACQPLVEGGHAVAVSARRVAHRRGRWQALFVWRIHRRPGRLAANSTFTIRRLIPGRGERTCRPR